MTTKQKPKKKPETELFLEIDTPVYIIEKTAKGKVLSKEPIDSKTVLQLLLHAITEGIEMLDLKTKKVANVQKTSRV
jgi:hypothetical protein